MSKADFSDDLRLGLRCTETRGTCKLISSFQQSKIFPDLPTPPLHFPKLFIPWGFLLDLLSWKPYHSLVHKWMCWTLANLCLMLSSRQLFSAHFSEEPQLQHSPLSHSTHSTAFYRAHRYCYALACGSQACWHWFQTAVALLEQRLLLACQLQHWQNAWPFAVEQESSLCPVNFTFMTELRT